MAFWLYEFREQVYKIIKALKTTRIEEVVALAENTDFLRQNYSEFRIANQMTLPEGGAYKGGSAIRDIAFTATNWTQVIDDTIDWRNRVILVEGWGVSGGQGSYLPSQSNEWLIGRMTGWKSQVLNGPLRQTWPTSEKGNTQGDPDRGAAAFNARQSFNYGYDRHIPGSYPNSFRPNGRMWTFFYTGDGASWPIIKTEYDGSGKVRYAINDSTYYFSFIHFEDIFGYHVPLNAGVNCILLWVGKTSPFQGKLMARVGRIEEGIDQEPYKTEWDTDLMLKVWAGPQME